MTSAVLGFGLLGVVCAAPPALTSEQLYAGEITFFESSLNTVRAPLNVTVAAATAGGTTASFTWFFSADSGEMRCRGQTEPTLRWTQPSASMGNATAAGTGDNPDFYSFQGAVHPNGTIAGTVFHPPFKPGGDDNQACGSFAISVVSQSSPRRMPQCKPKPGPLPPPPPPGPPARKNADVWPAPASTSLGTDTPPSIAGPDELAIQCSGGGSACNDVVAPAFERGKAWAFGLANASAPAANATLRAVSVTVAAAAPLRFGVDESYRLEVNATHAVISAPTQWGALHGLETFFQLVRVNFPTDDGPTTAGAASSAAGALTGRNGGGGGGGSDLPSYVLGADVPLAIDDRPFVQWRGLMIDTARHYLNVPLIKRAIDAMAASKLNNLHWHITDDQSFPLCLDAHPQLCQLSAYRNRRTGQLATYTPADVRDIVSYATARGVRITPELDLPGHSLGLQRAAPQVYLPCGLPDPTTEGFFELLDGIITELADLFPDTFIHMGGDEIKLECWAGSSKVQIWMKAKGFATTIEALGYFQSRVQAILERHGRRALFWDEFWTAGLPALNGTVAEIRSTTFASTLAAGRPALTTGISEAWYLDHGISNPRFMQEDWEPYYSHNPFAGLSAAQMALVVGGEVDMWGEGVDETNFEPRVFPYASAVAERLWSPLAQSSSTSEAQPRLDTFRCLLVRRGIRAAPIGPGAPCY